MGFGDWIDEQKNKAGGAFKQVTGQEQGGLNIGGGLGAISGGLAGGLPGTLIGAGAGQFGFNSAFGEPPKAPDVPGQDPRIAELNAKRIQQAKDFRTNLPGTQSEMNRNLASQERQGLASDMAQNKLGANRRGLLGSGLQQSADAKSSTKSAAGMQKGSEEIMNSLENSAQQMENQAIAGGLQYWQSGQSMQDQIYGKALADMQARRSGIGGLMQAGGTIAGSYAGRQGA